MMFFKASAFIEINPKFKVIGNPCNVVIFNSSEEMKKQLMSNIAYGKFPITAFVKRRNDKEFDLRYFTKDGKEFGLCGHGAMCAAGVIKDFYKEEHLRDIVFHLSNGNLFNAVVEDNKVTISIPTTEVEEIDDNILQKRLCEIFGIRADDVLSSYKSNQIGDYLIHLKNSELLRLVQPNLELLVQFANDVKSRVLTLFSTSNNSDFDIEVRVFSHLIVGKDDGDGEDVTCGSANCSIATIVDKESYKVLFPYQYNMTGNFGGIQLVKYYPKEKGIDLTGGYRFDGHVISF